MNALTIVLVVLVMLLLFGGLPAVSGGWHNLGWGPSGAGLLVLIVLIILLVRG